MGKIYNKGDIVLFKNIRLITNEGETRLDTRLKGHPFILLNNIDDFGETALCLKMSSSKKGKRKEKHLLVDNIKMKGMKRKPTYIEIANIYKIQIDKVIAPVGRVPNKLLTELNEIIKDKIN